MSALEGRVVWVFLRTKALISIVLTEICPSNLNRSLFLVVLSRYSKQRTRFRPVSKRTLLWLFYSKLSQLPRKWLKKVRER